MVGWTVTDMDASVHSSFTLTYNIDFDLVSRIIASRPLKPRWQEAQALPFLCALAVRLGTTLMAQSAVSRGARRRRYCC